MITQPKTKHQLKIGDLIFVDGYKRPKEIVSLSVAVKVKINKNKFVWLQYPYYHTVVNNISDVIR